MHRYYLLAIVLFFVLTASACGIKPGAVDSPSGQKPDTFPRTYPDLSTDPPPGGVQK